MIPSVNKETPLLSKLSVCDPDNRWSRIWKGIFGIRDLIKYSAGLGETQRVLTVSRN